MLKQPKDKQPIDHAIDATFNAFNPEDDDAHKHLESLERLHKIKYHKNHLVNPDTVLVVAGNLVGILMIVGHERANVVTSKALQFVKQLR